MSDPNDASSSPKRGPSSRDRYHHGDIARAAVEAALPRIADAGPAALSLRAVARDIGVNHRALYRHFEDRRGLLVAVAIDGFGELARHIERELRRWEPTPRDSESDRAPRGSADASHEDGAELEDGSAPRTRAGLRAIVRAYVAFGLESPSHYLVCFGPRLNHDDRHPELESAIERCLSLVQRVFERGTDRTELKPHDTFVAALTLWSAVHGFTHLAVMQRWNVRGARLSEWGRQALEPTIDGLLRRLLRRESE